ncbi:hypothetical protein, conserved [Babesia ovata]|uniref:Uncharacterized protein n=1 Tax=Babesia ovata TaxID=189622 RepID=A0A2H6KAE3_9APIC|nr:uncharacterized protein BOVATA_014480 [Babesia ovata]GBE59955.1 hypothetical protein, conserved [Babesia ovata]
MSYFTDTLPGHLPHQLGSVGCKAKCTSCSTGSSKMPCLTPLGFRAFSGTKRTGKELCNVLSKMLGKNGIFRELYSYLSCLVGGTPKTFADVFSFYYQLTNKWKTMSSIGQPSDPMQNAICKEIQNTVSCEYTDAVALLDPCCNLYKRSSHDQHDPDDNERDLKYLLGCNDQNCGSFIQPLNSTAYTTLSPKHAGKYLIWLVHVCPQIQTFLEQIKKAFCGISCYDSGCGGCLNSNDCRVGKHGSNPCGCGSITKCRGVLPLLYEYGFTYSEDAYRRTKKCNNFCKALDDILNSKLLGDFLTAIDDFFLAVRKKFIWTLVALWSLSLLYLLHIAVVRLDVLRIRSHLRSPASHRIAAQSLLAAARVRALANVKYFSP